MKRIFLFIATLISLSSFSQKFTLTELISLYENNNSFFDTFVTDKGYSFQSRDENDLRYSKGVEFNSIGISFTLIKDGQRVPGRGIIWIFHSDADYINFKHELSDKNFVLYHDFSKNREGGSAQYFLYTDNQYNIILAVTKLQGYDGTVYEVILRKVK
jgi:hypothetical protein